MLDKICGNCVYWKQYLDEKPDKGECDLVSTLAPGGAAWVEAGESFCNATLWTHRKFFCALFIAGVSDPNDS